MTDPVLTGDEKATAIVDAFAVPKIFETSGGAVLITDAVIGENPNMVVFQVGSLYPQEIIIVNPPVYVPDPNGDVDVNGVTYRYDPMAAAAEAIGMHVGGIQ